MKRIIVAGIGTDVGKTVVSAIIVKSLQADYWKPIQCGDMSSTDTQEVLKLTSAVVHPSTYMLRFAGSPHYAAELEQVLIEPDTITLPNHTSPLVIESAGGLCVPFTDTVLQVDLFSSWNCPWILVSKHYIGSINHSLLALEALHSRKQKIAGIIFNGPVNEASERVILRNAQAPMLGRLLPEKTITSDVVEHYSNSWKGDLQCLVK